MSTTADMFAQKNYLNVAYGLRSWLMTTDHKRIGWLYLISITGFFFIGAIAAAMIRIELIDPDPSLFQSSDSYNKAFSVHGIIMVWFFLIPSIPATLGNFLLPLMVGAKDLAFPRLNLLSWYLYIIGGLIALVAVIGGGVDTGWTFYTPFSTLFSNSAVVVAVAAVFVVGFSSILTGLNFIVTTHAMRAPGQTWFRLPLFVWSLYATSLVMVLATPVLASVLVLLALERLLGIGFFDPSLGGDPLLFQHLFWFYSHPAVYIMILPGMGVISEVIPCFAKRPIFGYSAMAWSVMLIALLGFFVWGHHMFVAGTSLYSALVFSLFSFLVAIPSAIKVFNWTFTLYHGSITYEAAMLYALTFVWLFTIGGLTGIFLASLAVDVPMHDTYFVTAHFHYIMVGGMVSALMAGLHFWWPKMTGRMYPEMWARFAAILMFVGFNLTFFPQYLLGIAGLPRRYHTYPEAFQTLQLLSSAGAAVLALAYILPFAYLLWSLRYGERAGANPWHATGLEWEAAASPPIPHNFEERPRVTKPPYAYEPGIHI